MIVKLLQSGKQSLFEKRVNQKSRAGHGLFEKYPMATLQEAASVCELSLGGVKKICLRLREIGVLEREGSKRDGRWIVK